VVRRVALLRGINVGGKSLIRMEDLRACVEEAGHRDVSTYIASGNVLFDASERSAPKLEDQLERAIHARFGLQLRVVVRTARELGKLVTEIPPHWIGNDSLRVNVAFLARGVDVAQLVRDLPPRDAVDEVAVVGKDFAWATRRDALTRSALRKVTAHAAYRELTIRNINTTMKLRDLLTG
jgi:uncharacterized protein (DUF1697 family)